MAGLFDGFFGGPDGGIIGTPPERDPAYRTPDMSLYGQNPSRGLQNLTGGSPGLLSQMGYPGAGGAIDSFGRALGSPLTQFGLALASGKTPQEGFGNAVNAQLQRQRNEQDKWPAMVKEYQYAVATGAFQGSYLDFVKQQQATNAQSGLSPMFVQNKDGTIEAYQLNNRGGATKVQLPEGAYPAVPNRTIDTGTGTAVIPNRGLPAAPGAEGVEGVVVPPVFNKDLAGKARETKQGTETATAITRLPAIESTTARALDRLDALEKHPGMGAAVGFVVGKSPISLTPAARDFNARVEEVQGESWTQGIETMRGLGALSDAEGRKIEQARSRLSARDVSEEDYKKAINDVKEIMRTGRDNARKIASGKMKPYPVGEDKSESKDSGGEWTTLPNGVKIRQK